MPAALWPPSPSRPAGSNSWLAGRRRSVIFTGKSLTAYISHLSIPHLCISHLYISLFYISHLSPLSPSQQSRLYVSYRFYSSMSHSSSSLPSLPHLLQSMLPTLLASLLKDSEEWEEMKERSSLLPATVLKSYSLLIAAFPPTSPALLDLTPRVCDIFSFSFFLSHSFLSRFGVRIKDVSILKEAAPAETSGSSRSTESILRWRWSARMEPIRWLATVWGR